MLLLPICVFCLLFLNIELHLRARTPGWRYAFLLAAIAWGIWVEISVELLSLFDLITFPSLMSIWGLFLVGLGWRFIHQLRKNRITFPKFNLSRLGWLNTIFLGLLVGLLGMELMVALIAPVTNFDSMTYHMPRVMHWIQNQDVNFYQYHQSHKLQCHVPMLHSM